MDFSDISLHLTLLMHGFHIYWVNQPQMMKIIQKKEIDLNWFFFLSLFSKHLYTVAIHITAGIVSKLADQLNQDTRGFVPGLITA